MIETPVYKWPVLTPDDSKDKWGPYWGQFANAVETTVKGIQTTPTVYGAVSLGRMDPIPKEKDVWMSMTAIGFTSGAISIGTHSMKFLKGGIWELSLSMRIKMGTGADYWVNWGLGVPGVWGAQRPNSVDSLFSASTTFRLNDGHELSVAVQSVNGTGVMEQGTYTAKRLGD